MDKYNYMTVIEIDNSVRWVLRLNFNNKNQVLVISEEKVNITQKRIMRILCLIEILNQSIQ